MAYHGVPAVSAMTLWAPEVRVCARCGIDLNSPRPGRARCSDCRATEEFEATAERYGVTPEILAEIDDDLLIDMFTMEANKRTRTLKRLARLAA